MTLLQRACQLAIAMLGLTLACGDEAKVNPWSPPPSDASDQLELCAAGLEKIQASRPDERAKTIAAWIPEGKRCAELIMAGCPELGDALRSSPSVPADAQVLRSSTRVCIVRSCSQLDPRPRLCEEPDASASADPDEVVDQVVEFLVAKLAAELGRPRTDPAIQRLARASAQLWATPLLLEHLSVSPPASAASDPDPSDPSPGHLGVWLEADGRIVLTQAANTTASPSRTTLAPTPDDDYDYEALTRYAQAQLDVLPRATEVLLQSSPTVPMQALVSTMDALRGTGCETAEPPPETCLYSRVTIVPAGL